MTRNGWNVTYQIVTQESSKHGEAAESGWLGQDMSFRDALELFNRERDWTTIEADCYPMSAAQPPRWFTDYGEVRFASGDCRAVSLHIPRWVTPSSAMRVARLIRCYGAQS